MLYQEHGALCFVHSAQHTQHTHHHGLDVTRCHTTMYSITMCSYRLFFIKVTIARLKSKLPDDGHRPKHVEAVLI
jgi:hypothetical protein